MISRQTLSLQEPSTRSQAALAPGVRNGVRAILMPAAEKTASKSELLCPLAGPERRLLPSYNIRLSGLQLEQSHRHLLVARLEELVSGTETPIGS